MPKKRFFFSAAGGIQAGAPFAAGKNLFVSQASPAFAATGRLGVVFPTDALQSIVAPGPGGSANSFVMGQESTEGPNGARSVIIGYQNVAGTGATSTEQILIGSGINFGANIVPGIVAIGGAMSMDLASTSTSGVIIGYQAALTTGASHAGTVLIGPGATSREGNSVGIGATCTVTAQSVAIGRSSGNANAAFVAIGDQAKAGNQGVSLGYNITTAGADSVVVGHSATAGANGVAVGRLSNGAVADSVCIGYAAANSAGPSIVLGRAANAAAANTIVMGSDTYPMTLLLINDGISGTPRNVMIRSSAGPAGTGSNVAGSTLQLVGAWGTGNVATGGIEFHTGAPGASGTTLQTLTRQVMILPSAGGAGAANIRIDNVTNGAGAGAGTLTNAPAAGDPTFWLPLNIAGTVRYCPLW